MKGGLCHKIFPLYGRGWAVDPPKKMTNYNEDTSSRGRISISLLWAKISDLPSVSVGGPLLPLVEKVKVFFSIFS